ncbi:peptidoglycan DD-metalloendopeptidase family protein [Craterilacuibacter sp. RT1T]|uniref:peptidoglycan DD-metalloendopeptidase family protein n=1 Tax=Craterilacuibacter sp. RT1T TaxID=2942211 RepID=UPI0020C06598|nr:peptidoglycan DD-metalloendopeptidase family protein [Craterilacuibacter sp. RT1T]
MENAETTPLAMPGNSAKPVTINRSGESSHTVQAGENLYRISLNNGLRHQDVAQWNGLDGFDIKVGQVLRLSPPGTMTADAGIRQVGSGNTSTAVTPTDSATLKRYPKALKLPYSENALKELGQKSEGQMAATAAATVSTPVIKTPVIAPPAAKVVPPVAKPAVAATEPAASANSNKPALDSSIGWIWPTEGKVVRRFSEQNKGLDIGGKLGQNVIAAGDGKVVYSGSGLKGYGKLIIIKHDKVFLSAYAHNDELLVKEGQSIKKGQKIATMGNTDTDQVKLHFEIREYGKPVNPEKYLAN